MKTHMNRTIIIGLLAVAIGSCDHGVGPDSSMTSFQLLFSGYGPHILQGIYAVESDGVTIKRLTPDSMLLAPLFSCSPDGQSILFAVYANQSSDIWKITRSNRAVTRVVADAAMDDSPQWLYDGSGFVFRSNRSGRFSVWMCDANGANQRQVVPDTAYTSWPIPSPRRPMVAYSYSFQTLFVLDYEHNLQIRVAPDSLRLISTDPAWAASGDMLAFEAYHDLYIWELTGSLRKCWTDNNYIYNPTWSPDAKQIAFYALDTLRIFDLSSQLVHPLISGMGPSGRSKWSPDGRSIAVETYPTGIALVAVDGGSTTEIRLGGIAATNPQWINATW
jgi:Tol biopolymer transport system component